MKHALVKALGNAQKVSNDADVTDLSSLLFEQAQILDGEVPEDPAAFAARTQSAGGAGIGRLAAAAHSLLMNAPAPRLRREGTSADSACCSTGRLHTLAVRHHRRPQPGLPPAPPPRSRARR